MHILTVIDHPAPASLTHAIAAAFARGAESAGHTVEIADLHAEGFTPVWGPADQAQAATGPPLDVATEQARIARADALCLVFPLYWYAMPAMLKGWIDRVWTRGWAFDDIHDPPRSLQPARPGLLLIPAGADPASWAAQGIDTAMDTLWRATFPHLGITPLTVTYLGQAEGSRDHGETLLDQASAAGRRFTGS